MAVSRPTLLIATSNPGKLREFTELLRDLPITPMGLSDFPHPPHVPEDGATYLANALRKAVTLCRWSNYPTLADDSGIEVDALSGAPGVHSARYAGPQQSSRANVEKLLYALDGVPPPERRARFRCVIVVASPDEATLVADGSCSGYIAEAPSGNLGFGYDPVFLYPPFGCTFAALEPALKNQVSHRAQACRRLRGALQGFLSAHGSRAHSRTP